MNAVERYRSCAYVLSVGPSLAGVKNNPARIMAKRAMVAENKRKALIHKRFKILEVDSYEELRALREKELQLSEQVKQSPLDRNLQKLHSATIKRKDSLSKQIAPPDWKLKIEPKSVYYELNLRLCRITKLRWFPPLGVYPGSPEDAEAHDGREWYCLRLDCSVNQLTELKEERLLVFHELRDLNLASNQLEQVGEGLRGLELLRYLNLSNNYIEKIDGLSACPRLVRLDLSSNRIATIKNLGKLGRLTHLNLSGNKIVRLRGLDKLNNLTDLNLDRNDLVEVKHLALVPTIKTLHLRENKISDMDEFGLTSVALTNLSSLFMEGNPVCDTRDYRLRVLENTSIKMLDAIDIKPHLREYFREVKHKEDLEEIVNKTTEDYMARLEMQKGQKTSNLEVLRTREAELEDAFDSYRTQMEKELQECISYIHSLDTRDDLKQQSYLATEEGMAAWKERLKQESDLRERRIESMKVRQQMEALDKTVTRSGVVNYTEKLKLLALSKPGIWQEMKRKEYELRQEEINADVREKKRHSKENRVRRQKINDRALNRQRHMLDHIDDYEVPANQWWEKDGVATDKVGGSPQRLHQRTPSKKHEFEDNRETNNGSESEGGSKGGHATSDSDGEGVLEQAADVSSKTTEPVPRDSNADAGSESDEDYDTGDGKKKDASRESTFSVTFMHPGDGFGMGIKGKPGTVPTIVAIKPKSPADTAGTIRKDHELLKVGVEGSELIDVSQMGKDGVTTLLKTAMKENKPFKVVFRDPSGTTTGDSQVGEATIPTSTGEGSTGKGAVQEHPSPTKKKGFMGLW